MSHSEKLPDSGSIGYCNLCALLGLDPFFRSWPNHDFCPRHRNTKPRARVIDGKFVYV